MSTGSVDPRGGRVVTHAKGRSDVGVASSPHGAPRGPGGFQRGAQRAHGAAGDPSTGKPTGAHETKRDACPSPRTRITSRLTEALAKRGLRHVVPLLIALAANAEGTACALSQPELAAKLSMHVSNVRRQEQILAALGLVRIVRGGPNNRRLIVLEDLDAQVVAGTRRSADPAPVEVLHTTPHSTEESVHPCAVSSEGQTAHADVPHIRLASARACAEEPLSDSSERAPPAAPWGPWRDPSTAAYAGKRAYRKPEWDGPSPAVDERAVEMHRRLAMWPNTLREVVICARDLARIRGEEKALTYLDALERHCLLRARRPGGAALGALRRRTITPSGGARLRQHVLEDVGRARHVAGIIASVLPLQVGRA